MNPIQTVTAGNKVDRTEWHTVVVFQRQAENCQTYLKKGSLVFVEGSLQTRKWQDQQGQDRYTTEVRASRVKFLDSRGEADSRPMYEGETLPKPKPKQQDDLGGGFATEASQMDKLPWDIDEGSPSKGHPDMPF